jgi:replicative DNA helicase
LKETTSNMDLTNLNKDKKNRRKAPPALDNMIYGKVQPQAKEIEEAILGAIMLQKDAFDAAVELLKPESFYLDAHQRIFRSMQSLANKSQPIDVLTVVEQLRFSEELEQVGGPYYVTKLTNAVVSSANIEAHSKIIHQKFLQREMIRICGETLSDAYEDSVDVFDLMEAHESKLTQVTLQQNQNEITSLDTEMVYAMQRMTDRMHAKEDVTGVASGFPALDRITHGWQSPDLIILAARPSVGKTAFAGNIARNAALNPTKPVKVAIFSLEMSKGQITERLLSSESEIHLEKIMTGKMEEWEGKKIFTAGIQKLVGEKILLDDTPALSLFELRTKARRLKRKDDIGLIIIDYLQLMSGDGDGRNGNREQEISKISRGLKSLAKELHIPIIALSQLSREPEKRKGDQKMPMLSDLRESGAIEQDADVVLFMYRPEYYDQTSDEMGDSTRGETHIKIAKNRNGKLDIVKLKALLHIQKFVPYDTPAFVPQNDGKANLGFGSFIPMGTRASLDDEISF